ncbi:hypothetical protein NQ314_004648 [Rhamnusium bicolor]|uniref:ISXO2-like transposase domain-containing protein n=1 Tax=Rhamnusium bicolor TaxID=1586634 RepID=A0AAV8ZLB5_9CUCU|nr:hypothetical protein NQ314_004648 [Rhamnusium bicolor]
MDSDTRTSNVEDQELTEQETEEKIDPEKENEDHEVFIHWAAVNSENIGGPNKIVEIDEAKIGKRKYNRGRYLEGQWVFGAIERETKRFFLEAVEQRNIDTLLDIIKQRILPGTTVHSDGHKLSGESPETTGKVGPECVLGNQVEKELTEWIKNLSKMGFPINKEGLTFSVKQIVSKTLELLGEESCVLEDPKRVWNLDEIALYLNPAGNTVIAEKGNHCYGPSANSDKENITRLICVNANGEFAPPLTLYKFDTVPSHKIELQAPGSKNKKMEDILKPPAVMAYNKAKKGVDVSDQMSSYYTCLRKSIKWYKKLFFEVLLGTCVVNSWVIYNNFGDDNRAKADMLQIREKIIAGLLKSQNENVEAEIDDPLPPPTKK